MNKYYDFVYELKKKVYINYVKECYGKWDEELQREYFVSFMDKYKNNSYIIKIDDKAIGFYNDDYLADGSYEVGNICIIPEYQHQGIGSSLLKEKLNEHKNMDIRIKYFKQNPVGPYIKD